MFRSQRSFLTSTSRTSIASLLICITFVSTTILIPSRPPRKSALHQALSSLLCFPLAHVLLGHAYHFHYIHKTRLFHVFLVVNNSCPVFPDPRSCSHYHIRPALKMCTCHGVIDCAQGEYGVLELEVSSWFKTIKRFWRLLRHATRNMLLGIGREYRTYRNRAIRLRCRPLQNGSLGVRWEILISIDIDSIFQENSQTWFSWVTTAFLFLYPSLTMWWIDDAVRLTNRVELGSDHNPKHPLQDTYWL